MSRTEPRVAGEGRLHAWEPSVKTRFVIPLPFPDEIHDDEEGNAEGMPLSPFFLFPSLSHRLTDVTLMFEL